MSAHPHDTLWLDAHTHVTIGDLAACTQLSEHLLRELVEYGALAPVDAHAEAWLFSAEWIPRCRTAARLATDLELETPMLALVLGFLGRIDEFEKEVAQLRARLGR
jgi:chaperone modulatory protein CbpM